MVDQPTFEPIDGAPLGAFVGGLDDEGLASLAIEGDVLGLRGQLTAGAALVGHSDHVAVATAIGEEAVNRLGVLTIEANGVRSVLDEGLLPGDPPEGWGQFATRTYLDIPGDRLAIEYTRDITAPILGASKYEQLEANLAAIDVHLDDDDMAALNRVSHVEASYPYDSFIDDAQAAR